MPNIQHHWLRRILLLGMLCLAAFSKSDDTAGPDIAIVVRPDVPVDSLTFPELRRLMLGEKQYWTSNLRVTLLVRAPGAREREVVLRSIYQMSEAQFRQYWIAKVFRAEAQSGPRIVYSNDMAAELASSIPGAVAFVDASQIPKGLKVLKINGLLPGQKSYPLH
jgi:ABC-type phosphate transport system substrate-binding protein